MATGRMCHETSRNKTVHSKAESTRIGANIYMENDTALESLLLASLGKEFGVCGGPSGKCVSPEGKTTAFAMAGAPPAYKLQ